MANSSKATKDMILRYIISPISRNQVKTSNVMGVDDMTEFVIDGAYDNTMTRKN